MNNLELHTIVKSTSLGSRLERVESRLNSDANVRTGIAIHDCELRCVAWSNLCEQLSGLAKADALRSQLTLDTPLLTVFGGKYALESALSGGTPTHVQARITQSDGLPRWISCTHSELYGAEGKLVGVISYFADVTAERTALNQTRVVLDEFQDLYYRAPSGHHSVDNNGVFTQINDTELCWLGYRRGEIIGHMRLRDILTAESTMRMEQNFKNLCQIGSVDEVEYDFVRKDGTTFPVLLSGKANYDGDGNFIGGRATVIDISEHRHVEQALARSEANLRRAQSLAHCGNYQFSTASNADKRDSYWSYELYRILGRDSADGPISTDSFINTVIHPDDSLRVSEAVRVAVANGTGFELEYRIRRPDGTLRYVRDLGELEHKVDDTVGHVFGVIQDVTELRQTQVNLHHREHLLASLVENSYEGIALFQANRRVSYISPGVTRILGYSPAELYDKSICDYMHKDDVARVIRWTTELARNPGGRVTDEVRFRTKKGDWLWLEVVESNQLHIEAVNAVVCNFRDITARKLADAELLETNNRLRELTRHLRVNIEAERTRIARELHDELGSMLTAIKLYLEGSSAKADSTIASSSGGTRVIELLNNASGSLARIVTNLRPSVLDNLGLLPAIKWLARQFEEQVGIPCVIFAPPIFNGLNDDHEKTAVFRICQEALNNIARHARANLAEIKIQQIGKQLQIEIRDDGIGYEPSVATHSTSWGIIGMRERAMELGGTLAIQSTPHSGTVVRANIPWRRCNTRQILPL